LLGALFKKETGDAGNIAATTTQGYYVQAPSPEKENSS
jgi:hypothetical protein